MHVARACSAGYQIEVGRWFAIDPVVAHGHAEHATHVAQRIVGNRRGTASHDAGQHAVNVHGLNVGWRDRPQHRIDVLAQDASHDFRMLVARLDVLREPDFTEPLHSGHFELQGFFSLLGCCDVDAALDLRSVPPCLLARILERQIRMSPEYFLRGAAGQSVAKDRRGLDLAVSDRSL
ncbi:MAG: hypothetical protein WA086_09350 [Ideonella sp.]